MQKKRVLVTGASMGIGRAIAQRLASDGWSVAIHYSTHEAEAKAVARSLGAKSSGMYQADLSEPSKCSALVNKVIKDGALNALVNNAGVYMPFDFIKIGDAAFQANLHRTFAVNFEAPLMMTRAACKYFTKHGGGKILNVCSRVGFKGESGASLYAASKAALINLTRSLAVELAPQNIGLYGIAPGWVNTAMAREGMKDREEEILKTIPLGKMAAPEDCGAVASFLLSDDAAYLSGEVIDINGASYFH